MLAFLLVAFLIPVAPVYAADEASSAGAAASDDTRDVATFATLDEATAAGAAAELPDEPAAYIDGEVIVVLAGENSANTEAEAAAAATESLSELAAPKATVDTLDDEVALIELPSDVTVEDALLGLANDEGVAFVQPNYRYELLESSDIGAAFEGAGDELPAASDGALATSDDAAALTPFASINDPHARYTGDEILAYGWWLQSVRAFDAWDIRKVEGDVSIAILDTGVRMTHDDLEDNILDELAWDAVARQPLTPAVGQNGDINGHGTHVA
ncbi:MAG: S8 family serine peptidase, partial [Coriobacteriales bacterium]|nr:S8 family serine peptidase [Coriobacteriales bacterium]